MPRKDPADMPAAAFSGKPCICKAHLDEGLELCDQRCVADMLTTNFYVACLKLTGRPALVVGGGPIGLEKAEGLLASGAKVTVVATRVCDGMQALADAGDVQLHQRPYEHADLDRQMIVIAATDDTALNVSIFEEAEDRAMLANVVDVPPLCNFILPAIVRTGPIAIAISTAGASPALAKRMKREISAMFGEDYAVLAGLLNEVRGWAKGTLATYNDRKDFFESIVNGTPDPVDLLRTSGEDAVRDLIALRRAEHQPQAV